MLAEKKLKELEFTRDFFIEQGALARANGFCRYKMVNGHKCAIGCRIPDEMYDPMMEGHHVGSIARSTPGLKEILGIGPDDYDAVVFWKNLQVQHDKSDNVEEFIAYLDREIRLFSFTEFA